MSDAFLPFLFPFQSFFLWRFVLFFFPPHFVHGLTTHSTIDTLHCIRISRSFRSMSQCYWSIADTPFHPYGPTMKIPYMDPHVLSPPIKDWIVKSTNLLSSGPVKESSTPFSILQLRLVSSNLYSGSGWFPQIYIQVVALFQKHAHR